VRLLARLRRVPSSSSRFFHFTSRATLWRARVLPSRTCESARQGFAGSARPAQESGTVCRASGSTGSPLRLPPSRNVPDATPPVGSRGTPAASPSSGSPCHSPQFPCRYPAGVRILANFFGILLRNTISFAVYSLRRARPPRRKRKPRMQPPKAPKTPNRKMDEEPGARGPGGCGKAIETQRTRRGDGRNHRYTQINTDTGERGGKGPAALKYTRKSARTFRAAARSRRTARPRRPSVRRGLPSGPRVFARRACQAKNHYY
jgi:hypothetical protein